MSISNTFCAKKPNRAFLRPLSDCPLPPFFTRFCPWYSPQRFMASGAKSSALSPCFSASSQSRYIHKALCSSCSLMPTISGFFTLASFIILLIFCLPKTILCIYCFYNHQFRCVTVPSPSIGISSPRYVGLAFIIPLNKSFVRASTSRASR